MWQRIGSEVQVDFDHLRERIRRRPYLETLSTLCFYWLKTVYARGYGRAEWHSLDLLLETAIKAEAPESAQHQALSDLRTRVRGLLASGEHTRQHIRNESASRPAPHKGALVTYLRRLLNEWLPVELAQLMIEEAEKGAQDPGIPPLAVARGLERILVRERLTTSTLEALLAPNLVSPHFVYPADSHILSDVLLYLLGRTEAAPHPVLPAMLLFAAPGAPLSMDYREAAERAYLAQGAAGEELRVPIGSTQAMQILRGNDVRLASLVVTMDGRSWQSGKLKSGDENAIVYRPGPLLRIDNSAEHARLRVPWPETRQRWSGPVSFARPLELFGREWRVAHWEQDGEETWLHLVFARMLPLAPPVPDSETSLRRSRPAAVDMAWAGLENALSTALAHKSTDPIEQLHHEDLIPLGRALFGLAECLAHRRSQNRESIEPRLRAAAYHAGEVSGEYGQAPWRIFPEPQRRVLLRDRLYDALAPLLHQVFDGLPEVADRRPAGAAPSSLFLRRLLGRKTPSRAA